MKPDINQFPQLIQQEYNKCKQELENCSYYGAVFALKDCFECILKLYVLCGGMKSQRETGDETILKLICNPEKQPSMGSWLRELLPICEETISEDAWGKSYAVISRLYQKWNLVKWRNDNIGHGALRLSGDTEFIDEIKERFRQLQELLQKLEPYVGVLALEMQVWQEPYFLMTEKGIACLDGVQRGKGIWLCYQDGKRFGKAHEQITAVLKRHYEKLSVSGEDSIRSVFYPAEVDEALNAYYKEEDYRKPIYMRDWLQNGMTEEAKGVFLLSADRGTGKSAFSYALDELGGNKIRLQDTACRAYFCNRSALRDSEDFVMQVSECFYQTTDGQQWRSRMESELKKISFKQTDRAGAMCECLAACLSFQRLQGKKKLLLIIDGIDELTPANYGILDFVPQPEMLPENVYILLTVRSDNPEKTVIYRWIESVTLTKRITFDRKKENAVLLKEEIRKACPRKLTDEEVDKAAERMDYRFSGLKIWAAMSAAGMTREFFQNTSKDIVSYYMELLERCYGSYKWRLWRMFMVLAMAEVPLDMQMLSILTGDNALQTGTLAILYDLKPLYISEHGINGGLFLWKYSEEMCELASRKKTELKELALLWQTCIFLLEELSPWQRTGFLYMATHIYQLWRLTYGDLQKLSEEFLYKNLFHMAMLSQGSEQYLETFWHLNALTDTVEEEIRRGVPAWRTAFIALVEMIHPLVSLKQLGRAMETVKAAGKMLEEKRSKGEELESILGMVWQYYGDSMILYAECGDMARAEQQYQRTLELPSIPALTVSLRMNHINMIKQNHPEQCLEEISEVEKEIPEEAVLQRANLKYISAIAVGQLARIHNNAECGEQERVYFEEGIELVKNVPIIPEAFAINRVYALCLEGVARWYAGWKQDFAKAISYMEQVNTILSYHNSVQNLVPPEDSFRIRLFLVRWYREAGKMQEAEEIFKMVERDFRNLAVELAPMQRAAIQNDIALLRF